MIARGQYQGNLLTQDEENDESDKRWKVPKHLGDNLVSISIFFFLKSCTGFSDPRTIWGPWTPVRVRPSHVFKGKMHFRGGLHLLSQKSDASFKRLSLKHSF